MFSDYLRQVLLMNQGERVSESAAMLFALAFTRGDNVVLSWEGFLKFELLACDYIFPKNVQEAFIKQIDVALDIRDRMRAVYEADAFNKGINERQYAALSTIKRILEENVPDQNLFVESWLKERVSHGEESAWELYIKRLSDGLTRACAVREAVKTAGKIDESANEELGQIIADVFSVVHYMPAGDSY